MSKKIYALYTPTSLLLDVFTNKEKANQALMAEFGKCELRTFNYLTESQVRDVPYSIAISLELTMRQFRYQPVT
jgi:hypothetical protein